MLPGTTPMLDGEVSTSPTIRMPHHSDWVSQPDYAERYRGSIGCDFHRCSGAEFTLNLF